MWLFLDLWKQNNNLATGQKSTLYFFESKKKTWAELFQEKSSKLTSKKEEFRNTLKLTIFFLAKLCHSVIAVTGLFSLLCIMTSHEIVWHLDGARLAVELPSYVKEISAKIV